VKVLSRNLARFADTEFEAQSRYNHYDRIDPFPSIPPALLTCADLEDYVAATGMILPFYDDKDKLKPASYEVALQGPIIWYDVTGARHYQDLKRGEEFRLEANSIAFVTLEPEFRVPTYLAIRFNLRITQIYRGLLLGTGPLVDPGFTGRLSLPIHNWTDNDYTLVGGEGLIWIEVTKLSPAVKLGTENDFISREGEMSYLPERKKQVPLLEYLRKADPHRPIRSSIPVAIEDARRSAQRAANNARNIALGAAAGAAISITAILISGYTLVSQADSASNAARDQITQAQATIATLNQRVCTLERATHQPTGSECQSTSSPTP
jgi:deoxycytidine triphosphate deaminase